MGLYNVSFSRAGWYYVSAVITPAGDQFAVGVKFPDGGRSATVALECTIDGLNWTGAGTMRPCAGNYVMRHVCGYVEGMSFRISTAAEPESVYVRE